jgi:hypothetical protein
MDTSSAGAATPTEYMKRVMTTPMHHLRATPTRCTTATLRTLIATPTTEYATVTKRTLKLTQSTPFSKKALHAAIYSQLKGCYYYAFSHHLLYL